MGYEVSEDLLTKSKEEIYSLCKGKEKANITNEIKTSTLLIRAVKLGDLEAVEHLIKEGIDVNYQVGDNKDVALSWCYDDKLNIAELLLKNKANPNRLSKQGYHPLIVAMENSNYQLARLLIKYNSDLNIEDEEGDSFLNYLISKNLKNWIPFVDPLFELFNEENKRKYKGWKLETIFN